MDLAHRNGHGAWPRPLAVVALAIVLAGCSGLAAMTPLSGTGPTATLQEQPPDAPQKQIGELVAVTCGGAPCLTVSVAMAVFAKAYWDPHRMLDDQPEVKGDVFAAVQVAYQATGPNANYSPSDWVAFANGIRADIPTTVLQGPKPELGAGTLAQGGSVSGWIYQEVPATGRIVVVYEPGGSVAFEVVIRDA